MKAKRIIFTVLIAVLVLSVLSACGAAKPATPTGDLSVLTWAGYDTPDFNQGFYDQYPDVAVEFSYMTADDEAFAKIKTGAVADVILPVWHDVYVEAGLMQPLDTSRLKVWDSIPDKLKEKGKVDGVQYFAPFDWGYSCILIRTDKVTKIPQKYSDLWDAEYAGHLSLYDAPEEAWMVGAFALGLDPYNVPADQEAAIKQKLIELKPNLLTYWADPYEMAGMVSSGDLWVVIGAWTSEYIMLTNEGIPVDYICLEEGEPIWQGGIGIPKTAANIDAAYAYIDAFLAPKPQSMLGAWGFGMANKEAIPLVDPKIVEMLGLNDLSTLDKAFIMRDINMETVQKWAALWSEVKASQ